LKPANLPLGDRIIKKRRWYVKSFFGGGLELGSLEFGRREIVEIKKQTRMGENRAVKAIELKNSAF
jgi:hypothetical protein